jgi:hypothetical protein
MSGTTVLCTIAAKNYLPHVRCLMDAVETHDPSFQRVLILVDEPARLL